MTATSTIEIDLNRLDHNLSVCRRLLGPDTQLCCVIKADAYGLGVARIANRMEANGVDLLAVYTPDQAAELVRAGISTTPILVLMPLRDLARTNPLYRPLVSDRLHCVVHDHVHLETLIRLADRYGCTIPVHVEIDTGMSRGGPAPQEVFSILERIDRTRCIRLAGLFTHFTSADSDPTLTRNQYDRFMYLVKEADRLIPASCSLHAANTHALARHRRYHLNMVRVGIAWAGYGFDETPGLSTKDPLGVDRRATTLLEPIVRWLSRLVHVKTIEAGSTAGYEATWTAQRRTRLGLVPIGYADGYPLSLSNRASVCLKTTSGQWVAAPIVGRISMDQMTIDLTDIEPDQIRIGTTVELFGNDPNAPTHVPTLADTAGTIVYEMLTRLPSRIRRTYRSTNGSEVSDRPQSAQSDLVESPIS